MTSEGTAKNITNKLNKIQEQEDISATQSVAENNTTNITLSQEQFNALKNAGNTSISAMLSSLDEYSEILKGQLLDSSNAMQTAMGQLAHAIETMTRQEKIKLQIQERLKQGQQQQQQQ
jgi:vacuolar-type H+-ATPase subunit C/Vma6